MSKQNVTAYIVVRRGAGIETNYWNVYLAQYQQDFQSSCLFQFSDNAEQAADMYSGQVINATITFTTPWS